MHCNPYDLLTKASARQRLNRAVRAPLEHLICSAGRSQLALLRSMGHMLWHLADVW